MITAQTKTIPKQVKMVSHTIYNIIINTFT